MKSSILFLAPTPPPFMGPTVATEILLNSSFRQKFDVVHLDTSDHRPLETLGRIDFVNLTLPFIHWVKLLFHLMTKKVDSVYIPISQTALGFLKEVPLILTASLFRKKVVLHLRGSVFREFYDKTNGVMKRIIRLCLGQTDRLIVLSPGLKSLFDGLLPDSKVMVVPNGKDIAKPIKRQKNGFVKVLFFSNLMIAKGVRELIKSIRELVQQGVEAHFFIAGEDLGEIKDPSIQSLINQNNLRQFVSLLGSLTGEKKKEIFACSDIFVLPSYNEGQPWCLIEALAAELPIISTPVGSIPEMVMEGENGYLVPPRDVPSLTEKLIKLIKDPSLQKKMGRKSRQIYESAYQESHFVNAMVETFESLQ